MKETSQIVAYTLTKLSQMFDCNRETMRRRLELVKPIDTSGKSGRGGGDRYTLAQVLEAYTVYERQSLTGNEGKEALDAQYERARKDKELADKTALENKVRRGELLQGADIKEVWTEHITSAKSSLRTIPSKMAPVLAAESDPNVVNELLLDAIDESLEELGT